MGIKLILEISVRGIDFYTRASLISGNINLELVIASYTYKRRGAAVKNIIISFYRLYLIDYTRIINLFQ